MGDAEDLMPTVEAAADELGLTVRIVNANEWKHGGANGVCNRRSLNDFSPVVEAKARTNRADLVTTLIPEYVHVPLHFDVDDETERSKREVEAEAVAYTVGRYFGLDTSGSAFYLAAWQDENADVIQNRLVRIYSTAQELIGTIAEE